MGLNLIADEQFGSELTHYLLARPAPVFLSRIGGSDTNAVVDYCAVKAAGDDAALREVYARQLHVVERFNGYYDKTRSEEKFFRYCEMLASSYQNAEYLFFCNFQMLSLCFKEILPPVFYVEEFPYKEAYQTFIDSLRRQSKNINGVPYQFVERMATGRDSLFRLFERYLTGKKILVVSPFSLSIEVNFKNRHSFFKNYDYPEFQLGTYTTPITYAGLPDEFYPERDWFETLVRMQADISKLDFDIALLSCGSYAMKLGDFISGKLRKKAIYVGGILQLYFGIMGGRYNNSYFLDQINAEHFILPLERHIFEKHLKREEQISGEAFGAYF